MTRLKKFLHTPRADRRLLLQAAVLHLFVAAGVRVFAFGRVRRVLARVAALGPGDSDRPDAGVRIARAVRTVASLLPGASFAVAIPGLSSPYRRRMNPDGLAVRRQAVRRQTVNRTWRAARRYPPGPGG